MSDPYLSEPYDVKTADPSPPHSRKARLLLRELPYLFVLLLTLVGVAFTSMTSRPLIYYWEFVTLAMAVVCIGTGWFYAHGRQARVRMIWTQIVHWLAFLAAMNIVVYTDVQRMLTAPGTGLALLMLLALGTFVAGVHIAWQICVLGVIMALMVPAIAWLTSYALFLTLVGAAIIGIAITFFWRKHPPGRETQTVS